MLQDSSERYLASFFTHLGALEFYENLQALGDARAEQAPVPRRLSVSCGTGVYFSLAFDPETMMNPDLEAVYLISSVVDYVKIWSAEDND